MEIKVQLDKHLPNLIGKPINCNAIIVGKIIEYDEFSGMASVEMYNTLDKLAYLSQREYYSISSRKIE